MNKMRLSILVAAALALTSCSAGAALPIASTPPPVTIAPAGPTSVVPKTPAPLAIHILSINASSSLVPLGLKNGLIDTPPVSQPGQAGWYTYSPRPGDPGPAVILGHVDGNHKQGVFWALKAVKIGDKITIDRADGSVLVYVVSRTDRVPKDVFPTQAVYGNTPDSELRVITCGGVFDPAVKSYVDNIIVWAGIDSHGSS